MTDNEFESFGPSGKNTHDIEGVQDSGPGNGEYSSRIDLTGLQKLVNDLRKGFGSVIIGQKRMVDLLIAGLLADGHVLIEGVPGVAKTLTAKLLAQLIESGFSRIQFTPDLMPSDVIGTSVFNPEITGFEFKKGPIFSNIVLIDEINRSPAKTQSALFEVMEERQITVDGATYEFESPFMVLATQNPIEQEGTYRLPEAQLDRFLFKIDVEYPTLDEEMDILSGSYHRRGRLDISGIDKVVSAGEINRQKQVISEVHIEKKLMKYIAEIVQATRNSSQVSVGASPRAAVFLMRAAQVWAAMTGRDFVTPDDVKAVVRPVLRHRIILTPEKEMEGAHPDRVIDTIVKKVEVPR